MNTILLGSMPVTLESLDSSGPAAEIDPLITLINQRINPPTPLTGAQIHVRSIRLVSDAVNDHGGRFPAEEHDRLCALLIDSPVLIGHDHSRLPVARNFAARVQTIGDTQWVLVWFYWMRGETGDRLAADIDGGVIKEGSIGFEFRRPQCSICSQDIRRCEHIPGMPYRDAEGTESVAHYEYREITRVLETSLVYRGATPNTRIGREALFSKSELPVRPPRPDHGIILSCTRLGAGRFRCVLAECDREGTPTGSEVILIVPTFRRVGDRVRLAPHRGPSPPPGLPWNPLDFHCGLARRHTHMKQQQVK
ncbi:MAG: hypothetical protein AB1752_13360 [Candidatus Zixiibacteriota bacterium]